MTERRSAQLLVLSEWVWILEPTPEERAAWRRSLTALLRPEAVDLTPRRVAEIAAWVDQIDGRVTAYDRQVLRCLGIAAWDSDAR